MKPILVFVELTAGAPRRASLEALGAARATGAETIAIFAGEGSNSTSCNGAQKAIALSGDDSSSDALASALAEAVKSNDCSGFMAAASSAGRDLAPRVAAHLDAVLFSDCIGITAADDQLNARRPWLAGKVIADLASNASVFCATTRLNVFTSSEETGPDVCETAAISAEPKARVVSVEAKASAQLDVQEAPVVISGGRGMGEPEQFSLLEGLAAAFGNATVGASRAVVDAGWRPHAEQVGQTGKTVSPQLYFAVGISGAIQHLAGMRTSGVIVAINKDAEAPIFKVADYGIVGDALEILPVLTEAIQEIKAEA
ncbi:MAG: electron transfer flavoprotein subunit alpha [Planctomycetes bacterium]|nr:electron transfer flavoprotein subunit alpha [Planctomycetota bacterium]